MQNIRRLLHIMARLRHSEEGCPWDREQDFDSLVPHTIEEAYEVADAIERKDHDDLRDELGDLLLQVVFYARIAEERALFDFESVAAAICDKLERRHPHVFAGAVFSSDEQRVQAWEAVKAEERKEKSEGDGSILDGIAHTLPALMQSEKIQNRAARNGFDWSEVEPVFDKVEEELTELREAFESGDQRHIEEEVGDLLFVAVNLARHLGVRPEQALKGGNRKFIDRFRYIEKRVAEQGRTLLDCALSELDHYWEQAKQQGKDDR
jgi:nucleoside triphosphate diphosphatase